MYHDELFKSAFSEAKNAAVKEFREELSSMEIALESFFNNVLECCNLNTVELER